MGVFRLPVSKMQHGHARQPVTVAQVEHALGNDAEVFSDEVLALWCPNGLKEGVARAWRPNAITGRRVVCGNGPCRIHGAEVVDTNQIEQIEHALHAATPPREVLGKVHIPCIQWRAPTLAIF